MATLLNDRDRALQAAPYRSKTTAVTITSTTGAVKTAKNGGATTPTSLTLTATPNAVFTSAATYTWHYALSATPTTWVSLGVGSTQTITNTQFLALIGTSTQVQFRCVVTEPLQDTAYGYFTVTYSVESSDPIVVNLTRTNAVLVADSSGNISSYVNTDTTITVSRGGVALAYSVTPAANSFNVIIDTTQAAGRTASTTSTIAATSWTFNGITGLTVDGAKVAFIITVYDASGNTVSPTIGAQIVYSKVLNGAQGTAGATGASGNKFATVYAYAWTNTGSAPAHTQSFAYTWSTGLIDNYPSGYTNYAPISPGTGYILYQLSLSISGAATDVNTAANWSSAIVNTIGYRIDGSIGPRGQSYRTCYIVTTSGTAPATPTAATGDTAPTGWSFVPTSNLTAGQYMYQSDGILTGIVGDTTSATSISWTAPYLSNLKVGSLDAISANMGVITTGTLSAGTIFAGNLSAATGTFTGALSGATGEFAGTLRAGVLDLTTFAGISYTYTANGTVTVPTGKTSMRVTLIGGGGGGGGGDNRYTWPTTGGGGGGGGMVIQLYSGLTPGTIYTITIGAGGAPGTPADGVYAYGIPGTDGVPTKLLQGNTVLLTAPGGGGGSSSGPADQSGGLHGGAAGNSYATAGGLYYWISDGYGAPGSNGGNSRFGSGGLGGSASTGYVAQVGTGYGAGGGGGGNFYFTNGLGGNGTKGAVGTSGYAIVEFFDPNTVVLQTAFDTLKSALIRQGIATV